MSVVPTAQTVTPTGPADEVIRKRMAPVDRRREDPRGHRSLTPEPRARHSAPNDGSGLVRFSSLSPCAHRRYHGGWPALAMLGPGGTASDGALPKPILSEVSESPVDRSRGTALAVLGLQRQ